MKASLHVIKHVPAVEIIDKGTTDKDEDWLIFRCPNCEKLVFSSSSLEYEIEAIGGCHPEAVICPHCKMGISLDSFPSSEE